MANDWGVTAADWKGCVWTGVDNTVTGSDTSVTPKDFTTGTADGGPYHVTGSVFNDYNAVALLGFNLNEAATGDKQCVYNKDAAAKDGPPAATVPSSATGIAVSWSLQKAPPTSFRIQIQGVKGATDANSRWCATIKDAGGPSFVKFSDFYTQCWNVGSATGDPGKKYNNEPIDAVVFLVPGTTAQKAPFEFTVSGFAPGTSVADAPKSGSTACGTTAGTIGSATASEAASMQRVKIKGTDCKEYVVQNNNWGNKTGSTQVIDYVGNSLTIKSSTGSSTGQGVPASFPSIYIGANGDLAGGTYDTWSNSGLPKQISAMGSAKSAFKWSGGGGGDYNASYDIWFSKSSPKAGSYNDAISGFLMIWLYKPGNRSPIGEAGNTRKATIDGKSYTVWRGKRGVQSTGTDDAGRPVISYVADTTSNDFSSDLKLFFADAVANAADDMSKGGTSQAFSNSWYLTDVFAGFEIWTGSAASGLKADSFTCEVK